MLSLEATYKKLEIAEAAFHNWKNTPYKERQRLLLQLANLFDEKVETFGKIITEEMHKPISQSIAEVKKCALMMRYYAKAVNILQPEKVKTSRNISEIHYTPMGVILGVMPWNFPFWQVLRFAVPAILAGNTVVLKHASICFGSGNTIEEIFLQAGFPKGIFQNLEIGHEMVETILEHPIVKGVSLTGSEPAGAKVAATAAQNIKKSVLELGGSDAFVVLADANLELAAKEGALARLQNCGQTCIAAKRFIIHQKIVEEFLPSFIAEYKKYIPGDPLLKETLIAGMARKDLADELQKQYDFAVENGAEVLIPLQRLTENSFQPGLIRVEEDHPILEEEIFGPLGLLLIGQNDEDCLHLANHTRYGLGNSVWTNDKEKALYFADNLASGAVAINEALHSMPEMPFGGVKKSGYGTELSLITLKEFTIPKSIVGNV